MERTSSGGRSIRVLDREGIPATSTSKATIPENRMTPQHFHKVSMRAVVLWREVRREPRRRRGVVWSVVYCRPVCY